MNKLIIPAILSTLLAGCAGVPPFMGGASSSSALTYTPGQAQQAEAVQFGTVISVQPVTITAPSASAMPGGLLGALAGGFVGSRIGQGNGSKVAAVVGAIGGGIAGEAATSGAYKQAGVTVTVKMDGGGDFAVTQANDVPLAVGQRVEVVGGYGQLARVLPMPATEQRP